MKRHLQHKKEKYNVEKERRKSMQAFHHEHHFHGGGYIREVIFGFNDGLVSTFALVTGIAAAAITGTVDNFVIVLAGIAGLLSGAVSMALGAYISSKSQIEYYNREIDREKYEIKMYPEREREEIREIYKRKGFRGRELNIVVNRICSNKKNWLKVMIEEELGLMIENFDNPRTIGAITGAMFVVGSIIPIIPYILLHPSSGLTVSAVVSMVGLFILGSLKTKITERVWWKSGLEMVAIGAAAAIITYGAGALIGVSGL
jgi:VIT1/CCC1 family predicted Fe2+/Mn2+ transporter